MQLPWWPVVWADVLGSAASFVIAALCVVRGRRWASSRPEDVFRHYVFLLTLAVALFAVSRSMGHLVKQLLLALGHGQVWQSIAPFSGATNSAAFVAIFAFCLLFGRIHRIRLHVRRATLEATAATARAEENELAHRRLNTIFDGLDAFVYVSDADHKIRYLNPKTQQLMPHVQEGSTVCGVLCGETAPCDRCQCARVLSGGETLVRERRLESVDRVMQLSEIPLVWVDGTTVKLSVATDVTETRQLEQRLARAQKMEALGTLAGGVAHDLNNVLSGILNYPELLLTDLPEDSGLIKPLRAIQRSGEKAATMAQDLLTLARRGVAVAETVDLNDVTREYLETPEFEKLRQYHPRLSVETHLTEDSLPILGSPVQLAKTVMNLISNAAEAMPAGGTVSVRTEKRYLDRPVRGYDEVREGDYAVLTVIDAGEGISRKDLARIFEPFFTKKKMGRSGTGLGMAVVWGTVKDHNGYVDVHSELGRGTALTLYFPLGEATPARDTRRTDLAPHRGNGESILVVDDVPEQRELAEAMLGRLGYTVALAESGEAAVRYVEANEVDLVLLDMIMDPGIDGLETFRRLRQLRPTLRAVIASGFSETDRVREAQQLGAGAYLGKPYTQARLARAVHAELGLAGDHAQPLQT